jgi:hypothetical protein
MSPNASAEDIAATFADPPMEYRPHTRWWWMGNAIRKEDLTWQLRQMKEQGIGGVEQITMSQVYTKGNHDYLSPGHIDLLRHAIREAESLGMEFSLNFGGPSWVFGGNWVPEEDRSQNMFSSSVIVQGGETFDDLLPTEATINPKDVPRSRPDIKSDDRLIAVVAGRKVGGRIQEASLIDITEYAQGRQLTWTAPDGEWQVMAFWLGYTHADDAVDHFSPAAMKHYCDYVGGKFKEGFGEYFGKTIDSVFADSFEVDVYWNAIYWSPGLRDVFREQYGYDLTRYLPALWWEVDYISPKIRYDVNEFLHRRVLDAFYEPFLAWCEANGVKGRIQTYGITADNIEAAGMAHLPEMEITAGEKDAVPWFDTRIGPKKYVASGAHLYGRDVVTVEAYTYQHWEPYRATLEELKIASDVFLRAGATKFYNHGYACSPERDIAPTRRFYSGAAISHDNVWWPHYRNLADYIARCSYLLRKGRFVGEVAVYSPLASEWAEQVFDSRWWTRGFDWGELGELLLANGYDFDLINDDILRNHAKFSENEIRVRDLTYKILILPNIQAIPVESMRRIAAFIEGGGTVVALERLPDSATGFDAYAAKDKEVQTTVAELFGPPAGRRDLGERTVGAGHTYYLRKVMDRSNVLDRQSAAWDPFLKVLHKHVQPDFAIDVLSEGIRRNEGLSYLHRALPDRDIYFVTNLQDRPVDTRVTFKVGNRNVTELNPYTGVVAPLHEYESRDISTRVPIRLAPYASTILEFKWGHDIPATGSNVARVERVGQNEIEVLVERNGTHYVGGRWGRVSENVSGVPARFRIGGTWDLVLEGIDFPRYESKVATLHSWTRDAHTKHFSGVGVYTTRFELPAAYTGDDIEVELSLGAVGNIAEVELNGQPLGVAWMPGQTLTATDALKAGENTLRIAVTNTLINRVSGLEEFPPVPKDLRPHFGQDRDPRPGDKRGLIGFEPLPRSGLLGPVELLPYKRVHLSAR